MNSIVAKENMTPCGYYDILGCSGFMNTKHIVCMTANGDNNFVDEGIVEGTLLFIDTSQSFQKGLLNVLKYADGVEPQFKLSRKKLSGTTQYGKVVLAVNQYK